MAQPGHPDSDVPSAVVLLSWRHPEMDAITAINDITLSSHHRLHPDRWLLPQTEVRSSVKVKAAKKRTEKSRAKESIDTTSHPVKRATPTHHQRARARHAKIKRELVECPIWLSPEDTDNVLSIPSQSQGEFAGIVHPTGPTAPVHLQPHGRISWNTDLLEEVHVLSFVDLLLSCLSADYRTTITTIEQFTAHGEIAFDVLYAILPHTPVITHCVLQHVTHTTLEGVPVYQLTLEAVDLIDRPLTQGVGVGCAMTCLLLPFSKKGLSISPDPALLTRRTVNGRQIKNAVRTAHSLVRGRGQKVGLKHFIGPSVLELLHEMLEAYSGRSCAMLERLAGGIINFMKRGSSTTCGASTLRFSEKQLPQLTALDLQCFARVAECTYQSGRDIIYIANFTPRLTAELDLGHEDLRQDERVMQLFSLANTLLPIDTNCFKRQLYISRDSISIQHPRERYVARARRYGSSGGAGQGQGWMYCKYCCRLVKYYEIHTHWQSDTARTQTTVTDVHRQPFFMAPIFSHLWTPRLWPFEDDKFIFDNEPFTTVFQKYHGSRLSSRTLDKLYAELREVLCSDYWNQLFVTVLWLRQLHGDTVDGAEQVQSRLLKAQMDWFYAASKITQVSLVADVSQQDNIYGDRVGDSLEFSDSSSEADDSHDDLYIELPTLSAKDNSFHAAEPADEDDHDHPESKDSTLYDLISESDVYRWQRAIQCFFSRPQSSWQSSQLWETLLEIFRPGNLLETSHPDVELSFRFHNWRISYGEMLCRWTPPIRLEITAKQPGCPFDPQKFLVFFNSNTRVHPWRSNPMAAYMFISLSAFQVNCHIWLISCLETLGFEAVTWNLHQVYRDLMRHPVMQKPELSLPSW
ncbi:hypothetical protein B0H17DRAFT_1248824 [Mycena rosella]|uniref:Uncharacterized protein n=1 Tax=Mycena rosella TaxID=1033263 RepID=A0AAD7CX37_MYCRO|nr:hypothetical protein B0H17DRAFT_1248824 [Mycena rosella]